MVCEILDLLAPRLKRLILHTAGIKARLGFDDGDGTYHDVKYASLGETLSSLTSLEICCSVTDALWSFTDNHEPNSKEKVPYLKWPKLRILALATANPVQDVWSWWGSMQSLERLLLTSTWGEHRRDWKSMYMGGQNGKANVKRLETLVVDMDVEKKDFLGRENWTDTDPLKIRLVNIRKDPNRYGSLERYCQNWTAELMLEGKETL